MNIAAARPEPIPVYAEIGSINPIFLLSGALARRASAIAEDFHSSLTLGVGQYCTNPGLVFVEGEDGDTFLQILRGLVAATPVRTMLSAGICSAYRDGVQRFASVQGVRLAAQSPAGRESSGGSEGSKAGASLLVTDVKTLLGNPLLMEEVFGPSTLVVRCQTRGELVAAAARLEGQLTATVHATETDIEANGDLMRILADKAGRLIFNGFPTGLEVSHAMVHGGPFPTTSDARSTSVGTRAVERFLRPVCYQNFPDALLPDELKEANPLGIPRLVDGKMVI